MSAAHNGGGSGILPLPLTAAVGVLIGLILIAPIPSGLTQIPRTLRIEMTEFAFTPAVVSVSKGRSVQLLIVNRGQIAHQFETDYLRTATTRVIGETFYLEVNGLDILRMQPGNWARVQFTPHRSGRYSFACTIEGHREAGMKGYLEVR